MCYAEDCVGTERVYVGGEQHASIHLHDASALREVLQRISGNSGRGQGWAERREGQGIVKDISSLLIITRTRLLAVSAYKFRKFKLELYICN